MRLLTGVLLAGVVAMLGLAAPALADTDVNFESPSLAACTVVTSQYSGITFLNSAPENIGTINKPVVVTGAVRSPTHALQPAGDCSSEFPYPQMAFRLSQTRAAVSLYARSVDMVDLPVQLRAYDAGGARIDQNGNTYTTLGMAGNYTQILAATNDNTNRIVTVALVVQNANIHQGQRIYFDDLHLTDGPGPATPDFTLGPAPHPRLSQGASDYATVLVNRLNGSSGPISFSASNVPADTQIVDAYHDNGQVQLIVRVGRNAPPGDYTIFVTGTPADASAGPAPRTVSMPLTITEVNPSVTIDNPAEGTLLDRVPFSLNVEGSWTSPRGVDGASQLCYAVTHTADQPGFPSECAEVTGTSGSFSQGVGVNLTTGPNYIWVFIRDNTGHVGVASRLLQVADETTGVDLRITGIEVTQGSQYAYSDGLALPQGNAANTDRYRGVQLVAQRTLWVRVFANTNRPARSDGHTPGVTARLRVLRGGVDIAGGPLMPLPAQLDLATGGPYVTNEQRGTYQAGYYLFTIPATLTDHGPITLEAEINEGARPIIECATCHDNDRLRVTDIRFRPVSTREIFPMRFTDTLEGGHRANASSQAPFLMTRRAVPFPLSVHPYVATVDITADLQRAARDDRRAEYYVNHYPGDYERDHNPPGTAVGVTDNGFAGLTNIAPFCCDPLRIDEFAVVNQNRPLTSVAHELGHVERLEHADHACGGDSDGQTADDSWPHGDPRGTLGGFAFNVPQGIAGPPWHVPLVLWYDYMSYCAPQSDDTSWLSARNWDKLVDHRQTGSAARVSSARLRSAAIGPAAGAGLSVYAVANLDGTGGLVTNVQPTDGNAQGSDPAGDSQIIVTGANGQPVTTSITSSVTHSDTPGTPAQRLISAVVPAGTDPRSLVITYQGQPVASKTASANAPSVKLLAPKAGSTAKRSLTLKWSATDADKDPLTFAIDEATGPGARFKMVAAGLTKSSITLPLSMLTPAAKARFRVRALDGFRQGAAIVTGIRVPTARPQPAIIEPGPKDSVPADALVSLTGEAFAAGGKRLTGRALTWRVDGRKVGSGERAMTSGLRPGTRVVTLTAKSGRLTGVARLKLKVTKVTPRLLSTGAPAKLSRKARTLTLSLAASVPSTVRAAAGGKAAKALLGRRARKLRLNVKPGKGTLTVTLKLTGGGRSATQTLKIPRA